MGQTMHSRGFLGALGFIWSRKYPKRSHGDLFQLILHDFPENSGSACFPKAHQTPCDSFRAGITPNGAMATCFVQFSCFWPVSGFLTHVNCAQWTLWMSHIGTVDIVDVSYWHSGHCGCLLAQWTLWMSHIGTLDSVSVEHTQCLCSTHTQCL